VSGVEEEGGGGEARANHITLKPSTSAERPNFLFLGVSGTTRVSMCVCVCLGVNDGISMFQDCQNGLRLR
jgi:hypothetical protein